MSNLERLATLIKERNRTEVEITAIIGRPAQIGHLGESIAAQVFDIALEASASHKAIDGYFRSGSLNGYSVNLKWYARLEYFLDLTPDYFPDYYLVMTGPAGGAVTSRGGSRPWLITQVFLFRAEALVEKLRQRGTKIGIASSVPKSLWQAAEIYPSPINPDLSLTEQERCTLALFGGSTL